MASVFSVVAWTLGCFFFFISSFQFQISRHGFFEKELSVPDSVVSRQYRTAYHFQPLKNWMNDPNAPMYYNGLYHLFYQYSPHEAFWIQNITWAHSVSTDLVNWTGLGLAFTPSHPFDINGCWSGSATFLPGNQPVIVYTGLDTQERQVQVVAYPKDASDPFLREWVKPDYNPVIEPHEGINVSNFRDPSTAWLGLDGQWRLVVGTTVNKTGQALLYKSRDFLNWALAENLLHYSIGSGLWECVDFFPLVKGNGEKVYFLKMSFYDFKIDRYLLGRYDEERDLFMRGEGFSNNFHMWPRLDHGHIYATKTFFDSVKKRRILWGWSNESDTEANDIAKGWSGIQAVPRVLSLDAEGKQLIQWPIEEIETLRRDEVQMQDVELKKGAMIEIRGVTGSQADVEVEFEFPNIIGVAEPFNFNWISDPFKLCRESGVGVNGAIGPFGLLVLAAENLEEHTAVYFRVFRAHDNYKLLMCTDPRRSSLRAELYKPASGGFVDIDVKENGKISLRTLIDHSVVESFGGEGRTCIMSRVYPTVLVQGNARLFAFNNGTETVKILSLKAWSMAAAQIT